MFWFRFNNYGVYANKNSIKSYSSEVFDEEKIVEILYCKRGKMFDHKNPDRIFTKEESIAIVKFINLMNQ